MKSLRGFFNNDFYPVSVLILLSAFLFFFKLGGRALWNQDELRYAVSAREMLETGDLIVPKLNDVPRLHKPPLAYWLTALSFSIFGVNEFAARFFPALFGLVGVISTYYLAKLLLDRTIGFLSGVILATSVCYINFARFLVVDMQLTAFITSGFLFWLRANYLIACLFWSLAFLSKGPLGIGIPFLVIMSCLILTKQTSKLKEMYLGLGLLIFLAINIWYIIITFFYPQFPIFFFGGENVLAIVKPDGYHSRPFYYTLIYLFMGVLPWSMFLPNLVLRLYRSREKALFFLILWLVLPLLLFTISVEKLGRYLLPIYPPVAILLGWYFRTIFDDLQARGATITSFLSIVVVFVGVSLVMTHERFYTNHSLGVEFFSLFYNEIWFILLACLAIAIVAFFAMLMKLAKLAFITYAAIPILILAPFLTILKGYEPYTASKEVVIKARPFMKNDVLIICIGEPDFAVSFYADEKFLIYGSKGILNYGSTLGNYEYMFLDQQRFNRLLSSRRVVAFVSPQDFDKLPLEFKQRFRVISKNHAAISLCNF